jgi:hypothetical protein
VGLWVLLGWCWLVLLLLCDHFCLSRGRIVVVLWVRLVVGYYLDNLS